MTQLKIIFAGTPSFATEALQALLASSYQIVAVLTQPDKRAGRGLALSMSPVKELALHYQLPIMQPLTLKEATIQAQLKVLYADVMVVAAYGMILPQEVLRIPRLGCINIHPSLLPRWRGAAPIQRTIFAGDKVSGVTIMQMDVGLDTGPILLQHSYILDEYETAKSLHDKMAKLGATSLIETLDLLDANRILPTPQDNTFATYATKIEKTEAQIDWQQAALQLEHKIRAFNPKPVAFTTWSGERLRIWMAKAISQADSQSMPGILMHASAEGLDITTGKGVLRLLEVQLPGGNQLKIKDFYHARQKQLRVGELFCS